MTELLAQIKLNKDKCFPLVVLLGVLLLTLCYNVETFFAQGDHGRDLYCFEQTMGGAVPYQDYWWGYGPLMLYYYSAAFLVFGVQVSSVLFAELFLYFIGGIVLYIIFRAFTHPFLALLCSIWFWTYRPEAIHTYNHAGGVPFLIILFWSLDRYFASGSKRAFYIGLLSIFLLFFVKINIAIVVLFSFICSLFVIHYFGNSSFYLNVRTYLIVLFVLLFLVLLGYFYFLSGMSLEEISYSFGHYVRGDQFETVSLRKSLSTYLKIMFQGGLNITRVVIVGISFITIGKIALILVKHQALSFNDKRLLTLLVISLLFGAGCLHEFILSGMTYRIFWSEPFLIIAFFLLLAILVRSSSKLPLLVILLLVGTLSAKGVYANITKNLHLRANGKYFSHPKAGIYFNNSKEWLETVVRTTEWLDSHLEEEELFFAIPYDPIYYFLTSKPSPTKYLVFFDFMGITKRQEEAIIFELERKSVNYVVLSNRHNSKEVGLGTFGVTYGSTLADYIEQRFDDVASFGKWHQNPLWIENHGIKIFKRKE